MATTSIVVADTPLVRVALARADDALILGHRLSEWSGHAPMLEEELALANIALDLIGQARALYALAGSQTGHDEDQLAFLRDERAYRNLLLVEQPNGDFATTIVRQLFFSAFIDKWWRAMAASCEPGLAAIAAKAEKESAYHLRHASEWLIRLGDGTAESRARAQEAVNRLWGFTDELFAAISDAPFDAAPAAFRTAWATEIAAIFDTATLRVPETGWMQSGGRSGRHSEHLGHLLSEMQYLQRVHPGAVW